MRKTWGAATVLTAVLAAGCGTVRTGAANAARAPATGIEKELRAVVEANFAASNEEDVNGVKRTLHPDSPVLRTSLQACQQIFDYFDLKFEVVAFRYLVTDGPYALARGEQKTTRLEGEGFKNNVADCLYIFRQDDGRWKLWQQTVIETRLLP